MKVTSKQFEQNLKAAKKESFAKITLLHGDDVGLARDLAKRLASLLTNGDDLALEKVSALNILEDASALYDAALSVSMFASLKVIIIEDFVNLGQKQASLTKVLSEFLSQYDNLEDTFIIIPTVGLDSTSALVKNFEKHASAMSIRCFVDSNFDLKKVVLEFFAEKNKKIDPKAVMFLQSSLGNDRMITLQELEKLDLYTINKEVISMQDCLDCIVSADSVNLFKLCDAIGLSDANNVQKYLLMLKEEGIDFNTILSVVLRHLKRLLTVKSLSEQNSSPISAELKNLKPPVFFGKDIFIKQAEDQSLHSLQNMVFEFLKLQTQVRFNPKIAQSLMEKFIFEKHIL